MPRRAAPHDQSRTQVRMSWSRHVRHLLVNGHCQPLCRWGDIVAVGHGCIRSNPANFAGRISGALLGYWVNGKLTFAGDDTAIGRSQLLRFLAMWLVTTAISTWSMTHKIGRASCRERVCQYV